MEASAIVIGLASAILTELLKLFPDLAISDSRKRIMAFIVVFVVALAYSASQQNYNVADISSLFVGAAMTSFISYKVLLQPGIDLASAAGKTIIAASKKFTP